MVKIKCSELRNKKKEELRSKLVGPSSWMTSRLKTELPQLRVTKVGFRLVQSCRM